MPVSLNPPDSTLNAGAGAVRGLGSVLPVPARAGGDYSCGSVQTAAPRGPFALSASRGVSHAAEGLGVSARCLWGTRVTFPPGDPDSLVGTSATSPL